MAYGENDDPVKLKRNAAPSLLVDERKRVAEMGRFGTGLVTFGASRNNDVNPTVGDHDIDQMMHVVLVVITDRFDPRLSGDGSRVLGSEY
jgi:hypothetical protein